MHRAGEHNDPRWGSHETGQHVGRNDVDRYQVISVDHPSIVDDGVEPAVVFGLFGNSNGLVEIG